MKQKRYHRSDVLQALYTLTEPICKNRFISTRPSAVEKSMKEFLLIRLPQTIYQRGDADQYTIGQFAIFVRDKQGGLEDTIRLEQLQEQLVDLFTIVTPLFVASRPRLLPLGSDGMGFHALIVQFELQISI